MSPLKQGRPKKNLRISLDLQFQPFSNVLNEISGEPSKWSLKNEWGVFSKLYFNTAYPRSKHAKASRDFFLKYKDKLLCSSSSVKNNTPSCTPTLSEGTICTQVDNNNTPSCTPTLSEGTICTQVDNNNTPSCTPTLSEGTICTQVDNSVSAE